MAICPKCKKEILHLFEECNQLSFYKFSLEERNDDTDELTAEWEFIDDGEVIKSRFYCPECDEKLFNDKNKALRFLSKK